VYWVQRIVSEEKMQIIELEDEDFPFLLTAFKEAKRIGKYVNSQGNALLVHATIQFMLVSPEHEPTKIGIKPSRSQNESEKLALQHLKEEKDRGCRVTVFENTLR